MGTIIIKHQSMPPPEPAGKFLSFFRILDCGYSFPVEEISEKMPARYKKPSDNLGNIDPLPEIKFFAFNNLTHQAVPVHKRKIPVRNRFNKPRGKRIFQPIAII